MNNYVYRITNTCTKQHYYGKRSCKIDPHKDLGIVYFSSSKNKEFILDQKLHPENYKYKIIKKFSTSIEAITYEIKLHNKFNVSNNPRFYNKSNQTASGFSTEGKVTAKDCNGITLQVSNSDIRLKTNELVGVNKGFKHSQATKEKLSKAHTGKKFTEEHKTNLSKARKGKSINHTKTSLEKLASNRYLAYTPEARAKISAKLKGRKFTDEHRNNISKSQKGIPKPCTLSPEQLKEKGRKVGKPADIFNATTNTIVAADIIIGTWAKENKYDASQLSRTTRRDLTKTSSKENVHQYKNMYAVYK